VSMGAARRRSVSRWSMGQMMTAVLVATVPLSLARGIGGAAGNHRVGMVLGAFLLLPFAAALLAVVGTGRHRRRAIGKFLAAPAVVIYGMLYFASVTLGLLSFHRGGLADSDLLPAVFPVAYYLLVWWIAPTKCPNCAQKEVGPAAPRCVWGPSDPVAEFQCEACGALLNPVGRGRWEVVAVPEIDDAWLLDVLPKLRVMRREMRPR
jgi:hypothetical protein